MKYYNGRDKHRTMIHVHLLINKLRYNKRENRNVIKCTIRNKLLMYMITQTIH